MCRLSPAILHRAIRTAREIGARIEFVDPDLGERPHLPDAYPDTYALRHISVDQYVEAYRVYPQPRRGDRAHADGIAWKLQGADPLARVMVVISLNLVDPCWTPWSARKPSRWPGAAQWHSVSESPSRVPGRSDARISVSAGTLRRVSPGHDGGRSTIDRRHVQLAVFRESEKNYEKNTGERVAHWQRRLLGRFTRNLALVSHALTASLYDLTVAARSVVDDNYAWEVWETAARYPHQKR